MKTILVIEAKNSLRESLVDLLNEAGFLAIGAENGNVGIQLARNYSPDLILCDVKTPELTAFDILEQLHQHPDTTTIPFVFLTANNSQANITYGLKLGVNGYLVKPISSDLLLKEIASRIRY